MKKRNYLTMAYAGIFIVLTITACSGNPQDPPQKTNPVSYIPAAKQQAETSQGIEIIHQDVKTSPSINSRADDNADNGYEIVEKDAVKTQVSENASYFKDAYTKSQFEDMMDIISEQLSD